MNDDKFSCGRVSPSGNAVCGDPRMTGPGILQCPECRRKTADTKRDDRKRAQRYGSQTLSPKHRSAKQKAAARAIFNQPKIGCWCTPTRRCAPCIGNLFDYDKASPFEQVAMGEMGKDHIFKWQIGDPGAPTDRCPSHRGDYGTNCDHCNRDRLKAREEIAARNQQELTANS